MVVQVRNRQVATDAWKLLQEIATSRDNRLSKYAVAHFFGGQPRAELAIALLLRQKFIEERQGRSGAYYVITAVGRGAVDEARHRK